MRRLMRRLLWPEMTRRVAVWDMAIATGLLAGLVVWLVALDIWPIHNRWGLTLSVLAGLASVWLMIMICFCLPALMAWARGRARRAR